MHKIKVFHEAPLSLMDKIQQHTDGDYCLPHLMDKHPEYEYYFIRAKTLNRYILMDNSLHELGVPYSEDRLFHWLEVLQPNEFFVPDYWQDKNKSVVSAKTWINYEKNYSNTKFIAVVQADNVTEAIECFQIYKDLGYKKIALSYGANWYKDISPLAEFNNNHLDLAKMLGRIEFIKILYSKGLLTDNDNIHLLGCSLPQEFVHYHDKKAIKSIDTSNPIISAYEGLKYSDTGLNIKPKTKIDEIIEINKDKILPELLNYNISMFRKINKL